MGANGSKGKEDAARVDFKWSSDATVQRMQQLVYGYGPKETPAIVDRMFIRLPWFEETKASLDRAMRMPVGARKENNVRGQGPSRAGKTSAARSLIRAHMPWRDNRGLHIPLGYIRVPAVPSVAILGQEALRALGDPTWQQRRSPIDRLSRIGEMAQIVGLKALIVDDLHHLVDSRGSRVQHAVADQLIDVGNETGAPFVFLGLERMGTVFDVNEQLRGRTGAPIEYLRLDWLNIRHRTLFTDALETIVKLIRAAMPLDESMDDETLPFRTYCSCGGLLGYLVLIFRVAEDECRRRRIPLSFAVLRKSVQIVVGKAKLWPGHRDPFHPEFVAVASRETLELARGVGREQGPNVPRGQMSGRRRSR